MQKLVFSFAVFVMVLLSFSSIYANQNCKDVQAIDINTYNLNSVNQLARSGCCSWHKGVCGCRNGRQLCCDGTLSPSCTCFSNSPKKYQIMLADWTGEDAETNVEIEIEKGNLVRTGRDIEIYDEGDSSYHDVTIESIQRYGNSVEIEVYDNDTGEYRTFEME